MPSACIQLVRQNPSIFRGGSQTYQFLGDLVKPHYFGTDMRSKKIFFSLKECCEPINEIYSDPPLYISHFCRMHHTIDLGGKVKDCQVFPHLNSKSKATFPLKNLFVNLSIL